MKVFFTPFYSENPYQRNLSDALTEKGVEVIHIQYVANRFFPILHQARSSGKPDVVHLHWTDRFILGKGMVLSILKFVHFFFELLILRIIGVRLIWTLHNIFNHEKRYPALEKFFHHVCCRFLYDKIIVMSAFSVNAAFQSYQLPENLRNKFIIIPHGHYIHNYLNTISKVDARNKLGIAEDKFAFLYFGQIRSYKGIFHLIEAFNNLSNPNAVLLIVGKPQKKILGYEIENTCRVYEQIKTFIRFVPDDEIQTFMNASDVVVFPFLDILNSGSVILAMSFGKAVICPKMGSIPEIINHGGGLLYNPIDPSGLSNTIVQALSSDLISMGLNNFNQVKSFDWKRIAESTCEVYQSEK